jgi:hypothetical protein
MKILILILPLCLMLIGCAGTPNLINRTLFNVETNFTPQVQVHLVTQTNFITQVQIVMQTNVIGQVSLATNTVTETNFTTISKTNTIEVPHYVYTDKPAAVGAVETGGGILGGLWGMGGLASTLALGAYHIYRQSQNKQVSGALIQGIETAKEVIKTTPQGERLQEAFQSWLVTHQAAAGVISPITGLVNDLVNSGQAQGEARTISAQVAGTLPSAGKSA